MKYVLLVISLVFWSSYSALPTLASEAIPAGSTDESWPYTYLNESADLTASKAELPRPLFETSFSSTSSAAPTTVSRLRDLVPDSERRRSTGLLSKTSWFNGAVLTEGEISTAQGGKDWLTTKIPGDTSHHESDQMVRFGLTRTDDYFSYGFRYRRAGQGYIQAQDQEDREIWGQWRRGWTSLHTSIGNRLNNVDGDPLRPYMERSYGQIDLAVAKPSWPALRLRYANHLTRSTLESEIAEIHRILTQMIESSVDFEQMGWNVRFLSSYAINHDLAQGDTDRTIKYQSLTAAFHPHDRLTVIPMLGYRQEAESWSGLRINSPSASLALQFHKSKRLVVTASGDYGSSRSNNGLIDNEKFGGRGTMSWNLQPSAAWKARIAVEARYNYIVNHLASTAGTEDIMGLVRLAVAAP